MTGPIRRVRVVISGRVQGVWYRGAMKEEAERLGLAGWVRNRPDGAVEAAVEGNEAAVAAIVVWCWRGPPAARVQTVDTREEASEDLTGFAITR